jgi:hypothetical protein
MSFRLIAKIGLLLVVIGFFMPIACDQNGLKIAEYLVRNDQVFFGVLLYILLISAIIGVFIGISILMSREPSGGIDWLVVIVCIGSGLYLYFKLLKDAPKLQSGAYVILVGWIIALSCQILSKIRSE